MTKPCVLVFVGCFNPPTNGHISACCLACDCLRDAGRTVRCAVMVPAHGEYGKPGLASNEDRLEMCRRAAALADFIEVDDFEVTKDHWSRTIDTIEHVQARFPDCQVFLTVGIDIVRSFETHWRKPDVLRFLDEFGLVVISRNGMDVSDMTAHCSWFEGRLQNVFVGPENPLESVSSTVVREALAKGHHICAFIAPDVARYIKEHNLYSKM